MSLRIVLELWLSAGVLRCRWVVTNWLIPISSTFPSKEIRPSKKSSYLQTSDKYEHMTSTKRIHRSILHCTLWVLRRMKTMSRGWKLHQTDTMLDITQTIVSVNMTRNKVGNWICSFPQDMYLLTCVVWRQDAFYTKGSIQVFCRYNFHFHLWWPKTENCM